MANAEKKEPPKDYKARMRDLCAMIEEHDKEGVNVRRAWYLYGQAEKLNKQKDVEEEKICKYIAQAKADLERKKELYKWSTSWRMVIFCVVLLVVLFAGPALFFLYKYISGKELIIILSVPVFLMIWGYIGAATYVLATIGMKISKRLLDPQKFPEYYFRLLLGAVFAAAIFYVFQLGFLSLPGTVVEEVSVAVENAEGFAKHREYTLKKDKLLAGTEIFKKFLEDLEDSISKDDPTKVAELLLKHRSKWEYKIKDKDGNSISYKSVEGYLNEYNSAHKKFKSPEIKPEEKATYLNAMETSKQEIDYCFNRVLELLATENVENIKDLTVVEAKIKEWSYLVESVQLEEELNDLRTEVSTLKSVIEGKKKDLANVKEQIAELDKDSPEYKEKGNERDSLNSQIKLDEESLKEKELKLDELKAKFGEAARRERRKPVWESAFFIVVAFFSGFSVNFVNTMFDRAIRGILAGGNGAERGEQESGEEPEPEE